VLLAGLACNLSFGDLLRRRIILKNQKNYVNCFISVCIDCPSKNFTLCGAHLLQHAQTLVVSHPSNSHKTLITFREKYKDFREKYLVRREKKDTSQKSHKKFTKLVLFSHLI
jgi:hypothetical protein